MALPDILTFRTRVRSCARRCVFVTPDGHRMRLDVGSDRTVSWGRRTPCPYGEMHPAVIPCLTTQTGSDTLKTSETDSCHEEIVRIVDAVIDQNGQVTLLESIKLSSSHRALVTILEPESCTMTQRPFGLAAGEFTVPDDFDEPLPDDILDAFETK